VTNLIKRLAYPAAFLLISTVLISAVAGLLAGGPWMLRIAMLLLVGMLLLVVLWLVWHVVRAVLYTVGRRLAFSYLLIGALPIPMVGILVALTIYLVAGFFLGHLYRDALGSLEDDLAEAAETALVSDDVAVGPTGIPRAISTARYLDGVRVSGDPDLPSTWPPPLSPEPGGGDRPVEIFVLRDGQANLVAAAGDENRGVIARFTADLSEELTRRTGFWVQLYRSDDPHQTDTFRMKLGDRIFALRPLVDKDRAKKRADYFAVRSGTVSPLDRPWLWWNELSGSLRRLEGGEIVNDYVAATLNGTGRDVARHLLSGSSELDAAVWAGLLAVCGLLGTIYTIAVVMAIFIIVTLTRAVNRLSRATDAVRAGDFSTRIPVRRKDQLGELQRSFNQMTANLESLVSTAAQKEMLDNELRIARNLQKSLLPSALPSSEIVDFATLFEPSAAIGGDYFDIFRIDENRLAIVIADVSGHGLPTGLRMAMLKAALGILVEEQKSPRDILRRLSAMIRTDRKGHFFATATVALVDFRTGAMSLTNAGHPPTYRVRSGAVDEILLPGNPLGALGDDYGEADVLLEPGDVLVWLSDGLIEATNEAGEPFGYDRVREALAGDADSAAKVRDRLVSAVEEYVGDQTAADDKTLVSMRYRVRVKTDSASNPRNE
jgi:serine phosphatase RsbU (regulator of sigma subunit)